MKVIYCNKNYSEQILDIFNEAILNSSAVYHHKPLTSKNINEWFDIKFKNKFPVIGIINDRNKLLGFGSYGIFRDWAGYKYTVEHSLYVHKEYRRNGYGKIILKEIIDNARQQNYHCLIAGIDSTNKESVKMHKNFGFEFCGQLKQVGYKFSQWLDLDLYQLILSTPKNPTEE